MIELTVALILAPAALSKAADAKGFVMAVRRFEVVPLRLAPGVAVGTIAVEAIVSIALFARLAETASLVASALLFAAFGCVAWLEARGRESDDPIPECGCLGGVLRLRMGRGSALLNLVVGAMCAGAAVAAASETTGDLALGTASLVGLAVLLAGTYWLAHFALSVVATMDLNLNRSGELK
jgi:hypothetical protein